MDKKLSELIYIQNNILLTIIADKLHKTELEKENFINKYNKKNYTYIKIEKNNEIHKENINKFNLFFNK